MSAAAFDIRVRRAFDGFTLDAAFEVGGGVTALIGPSGAGKTSLIHAVAGLLRPDDGRIRVRGDVVFDAEAAIDAPPHRRRLGCVFQDGRLFPHLGVRANLLFGRRFAPPPHDPADVDRIVAMLDLGALLDRRTEGLSGGERQRVAIGRALLSNPRALLMDEPLAALDAARKSEIYPYLERLRSEAGVPILYVSHAADEVARLADQIVELDGGRVVRLRDASAAKSTIAPSAPKSVEPMALYADWSRNWDLVTWAEEYADEAETAWRLLNDASERPIERLVEFGAGSGCLASHLQDRVSLTLTDASPSMSRLAAASAPNARHAVGDMRAMRLGETFDAVLIHDAVGYMTSIADLRSAIATAAEHLAPGGAALFAPDATMETFRPGVETGGRTAPDGRVGRWMEWTGDAEPLPDGGAVASVRYALFVDAPNGASEAVAETHRFGVFAWSDWTEAIASAGLTLLSAPPTDAADQVLIVARKPAGAPVTAPTPSSPSSPPSKDTT